MPVNCSYYYDNFFQKVTNMESPRKNNDCYFYYYSTCTKGDNCTFRHEPSALGCETVCSFWKEGKCLNVHCSFRHMELRKNRKAIPCYWETQPGGCLKPHCPFLHKNSKNGECEALSLSELDSTELSTTIAGQSSSQSIDIDRNPNLSNQYSEAKFGSATVDPLVVKFEEESDNESAPTNSPAKSNNTRVVKVKTLEEIRLEKIQAESAAYYFYPGAETMVPESPKISSQIDDAEDLRQRIINRLNVKSQDESPSNFEVLSLDQIRKRKFRFTEPDNESIQNEHHKKQKIVLNKTPSIELGNIKIKTLEEIREERLQRLKQESADLKSDEEKPVEDACPEVSSTSTEEAEPSALVENLKNIKPIRHLKRKALSNANQVALSKRRLRCVKPKKNTSEGIMQPPNIASEESKQPEEKIEILEVEEVSGDDKPTATQSEDKAGSLDSQHSSSSKLDDILLLDDDDIEDSTINLKEEDDILKDIDDLLNE